MRNSGRLGLALALVVAGACDAGGACTFNSECAVGSHCRDGVCAADCSATMPCPSGQACTSFGQCVTIDAGTIDAGADGGSGPRDAGSDAGVDGGPECGDGLVEGREECDDGNAITGDGCEPSCGWTCEADADCGDDDPCNGADTCSDHVCTMGAAPALGAACDTGSITGGVCRAGVCSARCDPLSPFDAIAPLTELNSTASESHPKLSPDELTVYFGSTRPDGLGELDIYVATRPSRDVPFGAPEPVAGVNTPGWEGNPSITGDGRFLYARVRGGPTGEDVVVAERAEPTGTFGAWSLVAELNRPGGNDYCPYVLPDHSAIYFVSDRGGTSADVYRATRSGGVFGAPTLISAVDVASPSTEDIATVTPDELTIYFNSTRGGASSDVWMATRARASDAFGPAVAVGSVNTANAEWPSWISPDNCELLFTGVSEDGDYDMYRATRTP